VLLQCCCCLEKFSVVFSYAVFVGLYMTGEKTEKIIIIYEIKYIKCKQRIVDFFLLNLTVLDNFIEIKITNNRVECFKDSII